MAGIPIVKAADRECGTCTLCCKLMSVLELQKREDVWCPSCLPGKGCTIYADRPESCSKFNCLWLAGLVPLPLRPDKAGFLAYVNSDEETMVIKCKDEPLSDERLRQMYQLAEHWLKLKVKVVLVKGDTQTVLGLKS